MKTLHKEVLKSPMWTESVTNTVKPEGLFAFIDCFWEIYGKVIDALDWKMFHFWRQERNDVVKEPLLQLAIHITQ